VEVLAVVADLPAVVRSSWRRVGSARKAYFDSAIFVTAIVIIVVSVVTIKIKLVPLGFWVFSIVDVFVGSADFEAPVASPGRASVALEVGSNHAVVATIVQVVRQSWNGRVNASRSYKGSIVAVLSSDSNFSVSAQDEAAVDSVFTQINVGDFWGQTSVAPPGLLDLAVLVAPIVHGAIVVVALVGVVVVLVATEFFAVVSPVVGAAVAVKAGFNEAVEGAAVVAEVVAVFAGESSVVVGSVANAALLSASSSSANEAGFYCADVRASVSVVDIAVVTSVNSCLDSVRAALVALVAFSHHARLAVVSCVYCASVIRAAHSVRPISVVANQLAHPDSVVCSLSADRVSHSRCAPETRFNCARVIASISCYRITIIAAFTQRSVQVPVSTITACAMKDSAIQGEVLRNLFLYFFILGRSCL